jgi:transcriptional regulator with XRE-family HTH domain
MDNKMEIGTKIKKIRELRNFTQAYMAEQLGIAQESYSRLEANKSPMNLDRLAKIAEILKTDMIDLLKFDEKVVFQNIVNHHSTPNFIQNHNELTNELYECMIQKHEAEKELLERIIQQQKEEIAFLRNLLNNK